MESAREKGSSRFPLFSCRKTEHRNTGLQNILAMAAQRTAEVTWENDLLNGRGTVRFGSGALPETSVTWAARTESPDG